jgi:hypothetical protein
LGLAHQLAIAMKGVFQRWLHLPYEKEGIQLQVLVVEQQHSTLTKQHVYK